MKNTLIGLLAVSALILSACGGEKEKEEEKEEVQKLETDNTGCRYEFVPEQTEVKWVGYKHSTKVAVPGVFETVVYEGEVSGSSPEEVLQGITGTVETASVFSNDTTRDRKLQQFFFNQMKDAGKLSARMIEMKAEYDGEGSASGTGLLEITMNGTTFKTPATFTVVDTKVEVNADIKVSDFNGEGPFAAMSEACSEKHTLPTDGKPVTWPEFHITILTKFNKVCE